MVLVRSVYNDEKDEVLVCFCQFLLSVVPVVVLVSVLVLMPVLVLVSLLFFIFKSQLGSPQAKTVGSWLFALTIIQKSHLSTAIAVRVSVDM